MTLAVLSRASFACLMIAVAIYLLRPCHCRKDSVERHTIASRTFVMGEGPAAYWITQRTVEEK